MQMARPTTRKPPSTNMERPDGMEGLDISGSVGVVADEEDAASHGRLRNASEDAETHSIDPLVEALTPEISGPDKAKENAQPLPEVDRPLHDDGEDAGLISGRQAVVAVDGELELLVQELTAIRSVLESSVSVDADDELLLRIRAWSDRILPTNASAGTTKQPALIPMAAPTESYPEPHGDVTWGVVDFDDGVYRGQVNSIADALPASFGGGDAKPQEAVPHGWGVVTSHKGLRRIGSWKDGEQVGIGSLQSAVFLYDGEWHATKGPSGYGIGTFAFGVTFVGSWMNGRPYGLGRLHSAEMRTTLEGWFHGTRCLQPMEEPMPDALLDELLRRHLPPHNLTEQPHCGLYLVGKILEESRLVSLRDAMNQWRRVACEQAVALARERRMEAIHAWSEAHAAERKATAWNIAHQVQIHRERMAATLKEIDAGREKHIRVLRVREFLTKRLETAMFQRDLARRCVLSQEESITLMEAELAQVTVLLEEATQAHSDCRAHSHQQQHTKHQIENASVKINALKHQLRLKMDGEDSQRRQREQQDAARRKIKTPATPAYARAVHGPRHVKMAKQNNEVEGELPFVCDVPGCSCGIPRDVFLRVAGAMNGE